MTRIQKRTIRELKEENIRLKEKIKRKQFVREIIKEKIVYKDLKEKPIPEKEKYLLKIEMDYPAEKGRIVLDSFDKIKRVVRDNKLLFIELIYPSFKPTLDNSNKNMIKEQKQLGAKK